VKLCLAAGFATLVLSAAVSAQTGGLVACYPPEGARDAPIVVASDAAAMSLETLARDTPEAAPWLGQYTVQPLIAVPEVPLMVNALGRTYVLFDTNVTDQGRGVAIGEAALSHGLSAADTSGCEVLRALPLCQSADAPLTFSPC
jgi:hypothetical protein